MDKNATHEVRVLLQEYTFFYKDMSICATMLRMAKRAESGDQNITCACDLYVRYQHTIAICFKSLI